MSTPERYRGLQIHQDVDPAARWLDRAEGTGEFGTVAGVCAPGFPAYARILHPAWLDDTPVRWSLIAKTNGKLVHPNMQWHQLIDAVDPYDCYSIDGQPGLWDRAPQDGPTPPDVAYLLVDVLSRHTRTPDRCWFGLWAGYGDLPFSTRNLPTFAKPGRDEILMSGRLADITTPSDDKLPDLWWPEDRAWCIGSDTDLQSTYIGGSAQCITELLATPGLEAAPLGENDSVTLGTDADH